MEGKVHAWDLKRVLPDWVVEGLYITDTLDIHENHQRQFMMH